METDYKSKYDQAMDKIRDLREDLELAKAKLHGDPVHIGIYREAKIERQRRALQKLNRRVRVQRLQLRRLNELERGLRPEEWTALKAEFAAELDEDTFEAHK